MTDPWKRLYNSEVSIIKVTDGDGYIKDRHIEHICKIKADIQPYNGGRAQKEYGLTADRCLRMYCEENAAVTEENACLIDGDIYHIIYAEYWDSGVTAVLEKE